jgi:hypothetical protein
MMTMSDLHSIFRRKFGISAHRLASSFGLSKSWFMVHQMLFTTFKPFVSYQGLSGSCRAERSLPAGYIFILRQASANTTIAAFRKVSVNRINVGGCLSPRHVPVMSYTWVAQNIVDGSHLRNQIISRCKIGFRGHDKGMALYSLFGSPLAGRQR